MAYTTHLPVLLWLLFAAGGCHLVLPLSAPEDAGVVDLSPKDLGGADVVRDQRAREQALTDLALLDLTRQDLPRPDIVSCFEQQDINVNASSCSGQCLVLGVTDLDCDGLLDNGQDPWPSSSCNRLLLAEAFDQPGLPGWTPSAGVSWSCAAVELPSGTSLVSTTAVPATDVHYLTEMKFTLVGPDSGSWHVGLDSAQVVRPGARWISSGSAGCGRARAA